jgi:hypothetical protein
MDSKRLLRGCLQTLFDDCRFIAGVLFFYAFTVFRSMTKTLRPSKRGKIRPMVLITAVSMPTMHFVTH